MGFAILLVVVAGSQPKAADAVPANPATNRLPVYDLKIVPAEWAKLELDRREQSDRAARLRAAMLGAIQRMEPLSDDLELGGVVVAPVAAIRALAQIHKLMRSADEWNADTLDDIAAVFGGLGAHPGR